MTQENVVIEEIELNPLMLQGVVIKLDRTYARLNPPVKMVEKDGNKEWEFNADGNSTLLLKNGQNSIRLTMRDVLMLVRAIASGTVDEQSEDYNLVRDYVLKWFAIEKRRAERADEDITNI